MNKMEPEKIENIIDFEKLYLIIKDLDNASKCINERAQKHNRK
ncbi:hypothetical protein [Clostridium felsineum]|nr:hypothetical protein [Clostridium felsineum]